MGTPPPRDIRGLLGIFGVVVPSVGTAVYPIWSFPGTSSSGAHLLSWAGAHQGRLQVMMVFYTVGVTLWLAFAMAVRQRLRTSLAPGSAVPDLFGGGMTAMVTLLLAGFTAFDVLVYRVEDLTPGGARVLYDLTFGLLAMSGMPASVALAAFAVAVARERVFPARDGVLAGLTAIAHGLLLGSLIVPRGRFSLEDWPITVVPAFLWAWILLAGISMLRAEADPRSSLGTQ